VKEWLVEMRRGKDFFGGGGGGVGWVILSGVERERLTKNQEEKKALGNQQPKNYKQMKMML
jgi:hypothetical protein